jgi:hypothetical protein
MEMQHEEITKFPCPCHESGSNCSMCASIEGGISRTGSANPVDMAAAVWKEAFYKARLEAMTEKLKKKIEAAWGEFDDKAAEAMMERMESQWQAMFQQTVTEQLFHEKLTKLYTEEKKD